MVDVELEPGLVIPTHLQVSNYVDEVLLGLDWLIKQDVEWKFGQRTVVIRGHEFQLFNAKPTWRARHVILGSSEMLRCQVCGDRKYSRQALRRHKKRVHPLLAEPVSTDATVDPTVQASSIHLPTVTSGYRLEAKYQYSNAGAPLTEDQPENARLTISRRSWAYSNNRRLRADAAQTTPRRQNAVDEAEKDVPLEYPQRPLGADLGASARKRCHRAKPEPVYCRRMRMRQMQSWRSRTSVLTRGVCVK